MNKKIKVVGKCPVVEPLFTIKPKLLYFFLLIPLFESQSSSPAMEAQGNSSNSRKEKKAKRQEVLEKKKKNDKLIQTAYSEDDHLSVFLPFRRFHRNGLCVVLESGRGDKLSVPMKQYIQNLLKVVFFPGHKFGSVFFTTGVTYYQVWLLFLQVNMEGPFGAEWPQEEKVKRREMVSPEALYIFVQEEDLDDKAVPLVGFVHYRFTLEEEIPVVYVYEIQLESRVQGKGLGKFLMQLVELIARKNCMSAIVLTVQKANVAAMDFYTNKMRYGISSISPSLFDPMMEAEKSYEILCKAFDQEAKAALEDIPESCSCFLPPPWYKKKREMMNPVKTTQRKANDMAKKISKLESLILLPKTFIANFCCKLNLSRKLSNLHTDFSKLPSSSQEDSGHMLMFNMEGTLLRSPSLFPYFMLVAFEAGNPLRALILLLLYPLICLTGEEMGLTIMVFVSFAGIKAERFMVGRSVLPKFFLEDVGLEGFERVMRYGTKVCVTSFPRIMVEGFMKHYLGIEAVLGRELLVVHGYFSGIMEERKANELSLSSEIIGYDCFRNSPGRLFPSHLKALYLITEAEKTSWQTLPREKYPKPLIFHDGRLAFRPTPSATLTMFIWLPFGFFLFVIRTMIGTLLPFRFSIPLLHFTGMGGFFSNPNNTVHDKASKGTLYVCNHRTLFDPLYISMCINKPLTAVTYSLSKFSEVMAPIKTTRITRNKDKDLKLIKDLLLKCDLALCPEGTTCREPYLLRFSPMFAEVGRDIVPVAIDMKSNMFYGTTAGGLKAFDPLFVLMNPCVTTTIRVLDKLPEWMVSEDARGKSRVEVSNYVQSQIAKAINFECTSLTRKDKYRFLANNEGTVTN
ncbi:Probable glycerol-3-phosphate acyltransferase 3 [Linum perenne]